MLMDNYLFSYIYLLLSLLLLDVSYIPDLEKVPEALDFRVCQEIVVFLEKFKRKTELVSGTSKPLAHLFFREILDVDKHLRDWEVEPLFCYGGTQMRTKYDKYWGDFEKLNDFMYFAVLLDPTMKSTFIEHAFGKLLKYKNITDAEIEQKVSSLVKEIESKMDNLFKMYKQKLDKVENHGVSQEGRNEDGVQTDFGNDFLGEILNMEGNNSIATETELKRYLKEPPTRYKNDFDILIWWKQNSVRFPIVSMMAKGKVL